MKGWRTIVIFALSGIVYLLGWDKITQVVPAEWVAVATAGAGILLRMITSTPVGTK